MDAVARMISPENRSRRVVGVHFLAGIIAACVLQEPTFSQQCIRALALPDLAPIADCQVYDGTGTALGITDSGGSWCSSAIIPEVLVLQAPGFHGRRVELGMHRSDTIQLSPLRIELDEVLITPDPQRTLGNAMLTRTRVDTALLTNFEGAGLYSAMQWVPGVQMDQRGHGGSTRLSIRGSLLRSPFGVRGVKVYWGSLPISLADGSTPLELLDPDLVGSMDVVRSIGPPAYGSAPSGLLLATPPWPGATGSMQRVSATGGSFGFRRITGAASWANDSSAMVVGVIHQRNDGYRQQESSARDQVLLLSRMRRGRTTLQGLVTLQRSTWDLPGALDSLSSVDDPRSANAFSKRIDARLEKTQVLAGVVVEYRITNGLTLVNTLHTQFIDKLNPFGTSPVFSGYKEEEIAAAGTRIVLGGEYRLGRWHLGAVLGTEVLGQNDRLDERVFVDALPDSFRTRARTRVANVDLFTEIRLRGPHGTELFGGVGLERNAYNYTNVMDGGTQQVDRDPYLNPVLGIAQRVLQRWSLSVRHGLSTSRPTVWEVLGSGGAPAFDLLPERVQETEIAIARGEPNDRLHFQVAAYMRLTDGLILPTPSAQGTGTDFVNAGRAEQNGLEAYLRWDQHRRESGRGFSTIANFTVQDHRVADSDPEGPYAVPGVPHMSAGMLVRYRGGLGLSFEAGARHVDEVPVGARSERTLPAYQVVHLRCEWHRPMGRWAGITAFVHIENLTGTQYTAFVQALDPLGRYFNPAPPRSVFAGLRFQRLKP